MKTIGTVYSGLRFVIRVLSISKNTLAFTVRMIYPPQTPLFVKRRNRFKSYPFVF